MTLLAALLLPVFAAGAVINGAVVGGEWAVGKLRERKVRKRAQIEAELDRKQEQVRATILRLAAELNGNALEARKALIRESFMASGRIPDDE